VQVVAFNSVVLHVSDTSDPRRDIGRSLGIVRFESASQSPGSNSYWVYENTPHPEAYAAYAGSREALFVRTHTVSFRNQTA